MLKHSMEVLSLIVCIITADIYDEQIQLKVDSPQSQFAKSTSVQLSFHVHKLPKGSERAVLLYLFLDWENARCMTSKTQN